jgi:hypothetical protein
MLYLSGKRGGLFILTIWMFIPILSSASGIIYQFNTPFPNNPRPSGSAPWLTADFENATGGVTLTLSAGGLTGSEFASEMYFNIAPNLDQSRLSFTKTSSIGNFSAPTIDHAAGDNHYKAGGGGKYDFRFNFGSANGTTFKSGDSITYFISGISGLTVNDFACLSAPAWWGGDPFYAAAHIQSLPGCASTWIEPGGGPTTVPVPEPSSMVICALGAAGCLVFFRCKVVKA